MYIDSADRYFIENKYHRQDEPFNPYNRFGYHGYECPTETGLNDEEMLKGLYALKEETKGQSHALIKAKGFAYILDNMRIDVNEHDYFVCLYNWGRLLDKVFIAPWKEEALCDEDRQTIRDFDESAAADIWLDTEHFVPDLDIISSLGITGILKKIKREHKNHSTLTNKQEEFFVAMETKYEAVIRLLDRLAKYAKENPNGKTEYVLKSLENIRDGVPKTTLDILQLMYIVFPFDRKQGCNTLLSAQGQLILR